MITKTTAIFYSFFFFDFGIKILGRVVYILPKVVTVGDNSIAVTYGLIAVLKKVEELGK